MPFSFACLNPIAMLVKRNLFHPKGRSSRIQPFQDAYSCTPVVQTDTINENVSVPTQTQYTNEDFFVPLDLFTLILCYLPLAECKKCALVCESWSYGSRHAQRLMRLDARVFMEKGLSASENGVFSPACVEYFTKAVDRFTDLTEASFWLAKALRAQGQTAPALRCLKFALQQRPSPVKRLSLVACTLYLHGDDHLASRVLEAGLAEAPEDAGLHFELGYCFHGMHRYEEAIKEYTEAQQLGYCRKIVLVANRANCLFNMGRRADALNDILCCLRINPYYARALNTRATIYKQSGELRSAYEDYTMIIEHPFCLKDVVDAYCCRATCMGDVDERDYDAAMRADPTNPKPMRCKANLRMRQGDNEEAITIVTAWLDANPTHPEFADQITYRGDLAARQGDIARAVNDYDTAIELISSEVDER